MGIYEIVIIICAVVIFIILIRRFPETVETHGNTGGFHMPKTSFKFPKPHFSIPKPKININSGKNIADAKPADPFPFDQDQSVADIPKAQTKQSEPGTNFDNLVDIPAAQRQILRDANKYFELKQFDMAEKLYLQAAAADPTCVSAYYRLGVIYMSHKESISDALEALNQANKFEPDNGYILNALGQVSVLKNLFHESITYFEQSIAADGGITERHANIGMAYLSSRQYTKAARHFSKAWSLEPSNAKYKELLDDAKDRERRLRAART